MRSPRRQLPPSGCDAKPLHSDRKHIVDTSGFKNATYQKKNVTVSAPREISREEIIKAMHPAYDGRYLRQTSWKADKYVYYQHLAIKIIVVAVNVMSKLCWPILLTKQTDWSAKPHIQLTKQENQSAETNQML